MLWEHTEIVEMAVGIERIHGGDKFQVGTWWKEICKFHNNKDLSLIKTIARIDEGPKSWSFHVSYPSSKWGYEDQVTTTTFTITPADEQHSILIGSFKPWENYISTYWIIFHGEIFIEITAKWWNNYFNYTMADIVQNITVHFSRYKPI
jgi:hypothetical protein